MCTVVLRFGLPVLALAWLAGCAAPADQPDADATIQSAERVARMLAGNYVGTSKQSGSPVDSGGLVRLEVRVERIAASGVVVRMEQREDDSAPRSFVVVFRPTMIGTRLEGDFSPLDPQGRELGSCPIEVSVQSDGFVARTSAASCRFGQGEGAAALIKEIAHDGQRLVIGDRVVDPDSGEALMSDRVLEFEQVQRFVGWAGVLDSDASWRIAEGIALESDGLGLDPEDAGGMTLGIALDLAPHRVRDGQPPVLRLRVFDRDSGELLGQSWADPQATRIGLALPTVQVGLRLRNTRKQ
ncbi:MAG: hypothetical protein WD397_04905 [Wenzhouxiangellaceae bacterium]